MSERFRENYFIIIRVIILLILSVYGLLSSPDKTGVSVEMLLLVSFYIGVMTFKELTKNNKKILLTITGIILYFLILYLDGMSFFLLGFFTVYETMSLFPEIDFKWYFLPIIGVFIDVGTGFIPQTVVVLMMAVLYIQNNYVIAGYKKRMKEDVLIEQELKKDMVRQEDETQNEIKKNMLAAENKVLEERAALSQTLHDKLGHSINGSIYQLEGVKLLMENDPEKSKDMVQAVIDQLRTGMDEIRAILRKERPEKKELALLQLYQLCEDCINKGVDTEFDAEGETAKISDGLWELILDNAFEAVSNSMKYAKCKHIKISIVVMNRMLRCSITDDGVGCTEIHDGMGISGMRSRVRSVGGTLSFETEAGFTVTMLLPLEE